MPTRSFDVVILAGGNAGMGVTVATREAGHTVAMIPPDLLGGTCPNRGCMPKKCWSRRHSRSTSSSAPRHTTPTSASRASTGRR
jgi:glutathione reductase (NADPH)